MFLYTFPNLRFGFLPRNPEPSFELRLSALSYFVRALLKPDSRSLPMRIFVRYQNLDSRHAITAVPGTPAGFPESKFFPPPVISRCGLAGCDLALLRMRLPVSWSTPGSTCP